MSEFSHVTSDWLHGISAGDLRVAITATVILRGGDITPGEAITPHVNVYPDASSRAWSATERAPGLQVLGLGGRSEPYPSFVPTTDEISEARRMAEGHHAHDAEPSRLFESAIHLIRGPLVLHEADLLHKLIAPCADDVCAVFEEDHIVCKFLRVASDISRDEEGVYAFRYAWLQIALAAPWLLDRQGSA